MAVLVVGATGRTGLPLVEQLLSKNYEVRVVVRSSGKLPTEVLNHPNITVTEADLLDLADEEMAEHMNGCEAVVSCLGHVIDFKGMFGNPKKLCTDATRRLCDAIEINRPAEPTKFILMNTIAVQNPDLNEKRTLFERGVFTLFRLALPPHRDNETAAAHLRYVVGKDNKLIEWCSVRPEALIDAEVSPFEVIESYTGNAFRGRPTTRANVAQFMAELIEDTELWSTWKFRMPVIADSESAVSK